MKISDRFWDAMNKSTLVSSLLALLVWSVISYLAITHSEVPEVLVLGGGSVLGYFFGSRSGQQIERVQAANAAIAGRLHEVTRDA